MKLRPVRRLLLVFPPERAMHGFFRADVPPLGAAYLAAAVRDDCEVAILDAKHEGYNLVRRDGPFDVYGLDADAVRDRIAAFQPDAVGLTCLASCNWPDVRAVAAAAKSVAPGILTIAGGTHPSFLAERCLAEAPELDLIVAGEGETALRALIAESRASADPAAVPSLVWREGDKVRRNPPAPPITDLDALPFPARDLLDMEGYFQNRAPFSRIFREERNTSIQTSRGCPAHCSFCSSARYWGHGFRPQSPKRALAEMEHLVEKYGVFELQFVDDNLIFDRDRAVAIFQGMIDRGLNLKWCMPNGVAVWRLDVELLRLMRRAGCYSLTLAFESGNQRVLSRIVRKPLNLGKVGPLVEEMKRLEFDLHAFFISGFPGETVGEMEDTFRLARSLDLDGAYFFIATPLPGTELCEKGMAAGHLRPDLDFTRIEYNKGHFNTPEWTAEEVERLTGSFYLRFMLSALLRHPVRFLGNYGRVIMTRPWYAAEHLLVYARRGIERALGGRRGPQSRTGSE